MRLRDSISAGMSLASFHNLFRNGIVLVTMASAAICFGGSTAKIHPIQEQQLKSMSLEQLGNVKVTIASKQPEEVWKTPAAVSVITSEDIRRSSATTLPELLRLVPGVQVSRMQSDAWAVGIRGFANQFSKGLLVMIDGRSVYTPLFEGVYWDVQDLPLNDIDRIEVIRGPAGAVWGANAVNGVINIITKHARETHGYAASVIGGGSLERFIGEAQGGWRPSKNLQASLFAKGFNRGPELNPGGNPYDDWHQNRGGFRIDWQPNHRDTLMAEAQIYQGESGVENSVGHLDPPEQVVIDGDQPVSGGDILLRWDRTLSANSNFYLQGYFDRTNRGGPLGFEGRDTFDLEFVDQVRSLPMQDLIFGGDLRWSPSVFIQTADALNFTPNSLTDYLFSGFIQDKVKIAPDRLSVTLGTKLEDNNYSGVGLEPSASVLWNPTLHQTLWGSVERALRIPGRLDRDVTILGVVSKAPPIILEIRGNPRFNPEVLISWQAGYRRLLTSKFFFDLALFHNQYDNLATYGNPPLVPSFPTQPFRYELLTATYANGAKGVTNGMEVAPDWKPLPWLDLRGNYSKLDMDLHGKAGFGKVAYISPQYQGSSPTNMATIQGLVALPHGIEIDPDYRYMGSLPAMKCPAYQTMDAHIGWKIKKHFRLTVDGRNLLQPSHREFLGDNSNQVGIRREVFGGIAWMP